MDSTAVLIKDLRKVYLGEMRARERVLSFFSLSSRLKQQQNETDFALQDIDLKVAKGEVVGIVGDNGSGKSTLLKIIAGVLEPTNGEVRVEGTISSILELGAGFNPELSGLENIKLQEIIYGEKLGDRINEIIEFSDLGDRIYSKVKTYSSGMFARLAFSVAINMEPSILIVDEALSVGDLKFVNKCIDRINRYVASPDKTLIFVSHDLTLVRRLVDRVLWLKNGRILMDGDTNLVLDKYVTSSSLQSKGEHLDSEISNQPMFGDYKVKFGSGKAVKIGTVMVNKIIASPLEKIVAITNDTIQINVECRIIQDITKIGISISFFDSKGTICFSNGIVRNSKVGDVQNVCFNIEKMPLLRGEFSMSVGIWDENFVSPIELRERYYDISIISPDNQEDGLFVLDGFSWS